MKSLVLILALVFSASTFADTLKDKGAAKNLAESVMALVAEGKVAEGILLTKPYLIIPEHEFEGMLDSLKMQAPMMEQRFGKTIGIEFSAIEEVGESLMLVMYIQKFEKHDKIINILFLFTILFKSVRVFLMIVNI